MKKGPEIGAIVMYKGLDFGFGDARPESYIVLSHPYKDAHTKFWMIHARRTINGHIEEIELARIA
jgi:hypothetical protein